MACSCHVDAMALRRYCHDIAMSLPPYDKQKHGNNTGGNMHANIMATAWRMATSCQYHGNNMEVTWQ
jgi:hypothetical protein